MKDYNWKKLIIVVVSCTILGGIVGMLTNMIISNNPIAFLEMIEPKFYYLYIAAAIIGTISLLFCGYFFTTIKREGFSEDEGSFYQRNENKITVAMSMSTICGVLNFTALGLTITSEGQKLYSILLLINVCLCFIGEVSYIALIKRVRPELNADPLNVGFKTDLFDKMDEFEKYKSGKAAFDTMSAMTIVYVALFCICYLTSAIFKISPLICVPVGLIWLSQIILQIVYSIKSSGNQANH